MSGDSRLIRVLVACHPAGWRHRYGNEYAQLLHDMRVHRLQRKFRTGKKRSGPWFLRH